MHQLELSPTTDDVLDFVCDWIVNKSGFDEFPLDESYLELNLIDSMGLIELIEAVEYEYAIEFSPLEFQDERFVTTIGLSEIINEKLHS